MRNLNFFYILLFILCTIRVFGQVSFRNPTYPTGFGAPSDFQVGGKYVDTPSDPVTIYDTGSNTLSYTVQLYRPAGSGSGYVDVFLGSSQNSLAPSPSNTSSQRLTTTGKTWLAMNDSNGNPTGYESLFLSGTFAIYGSNVGSYTGFYAVYYEGTSSSSTKGEVSHPVLLKVITRPPSNSYDPNYPCGRSVEICSDQCVEYNGTPALLAGRVFISSEFEEGQWQYSLDNSSWYDLAGQTSANCQPGPITFTTYFRRVSTHEEGVFHHRAYWYTSNTVTVSVRGSVPSPVVSTYNVSTCGNTTQNVQIGVNQRLANKSLNWWVPYPGWTVNGYSTVNTNSSFVTTDTGVTLSIPAGTANGTYYIRVSANGDCGTKSADAVIPVNINQNPLGTPINISFYRNYDSGNDCNWYYDATSGLVPGATSYHASATGGYEADGIVVASSGVVVFPLNIYGGYNATVTITASNACGTGPAGSLTQYLDQANPGCDYQYVVMYPNPTSDGVKLNNGGQAGQATFYDTQGVARKVITLHERQGETDVNMLDLPNGTYHVRIISNGKVRLDKQLVVKH